MVEFGERLKFLRNHHKMSQEQLANICGLTRSVISAYESGIRKPSYDVLICISKTFGVSTDYLLGINQKENIDLNGLTKEEKEIIYSLVETLKSK